MANRVTTTEVKAIISTSRIDIDAFISAANSLVTDELTDCGYSDTRLKEIERWLAAHFIATAPESSSNTIGGSKEIEEIEVDDSRIRYAIDSLGRSLPTTSYGKQAMLLDTCGKLAAIGKPNALFRVIAP